VSLQLPLLLLVVAFTSIPTELRPLGSAAIAEVFDTSLDVPDILANVIGYIPVGVVLSTRGPWPAIGLAAAVSVFAETTQIFSEGRSPSLIDVVTNVVGAALGVAICAALKFRPVPVAVTRRIAAVAGVLAIAYVGLGSRIVPNDVEDAIASLVSTHLDDTNPRGATAPGRLESRWTFDRITGNTAVDDGGGGLNGVLVNRPGLVDGVTGRAILLNGKNQWVNVPDPFALHLIGSMTISAWIKPSAFPHDDAAIASTFAGRGYELDATDDQGARTIGFKLTDAAGRLMARYGRTLLQTNRWYHVAGVYDADAGTLDVYVNGHPDSGCLAGQVTNRQLVSASDVFIGRRGGDRGFEFAGAIDDVRIYSRALHSSEVESEFAQAPARAIDHTLIEHVSDGLCHAQPEGAYARVAGPVMTFGMLVAVACVGIWPGSRYRRASLLIGFLSGFALLPVIAPVVPPFYVWILPLLTAAGGLAVAASSTP